MTVEITSRETFDPTVIEGDFHEVVSSLNIAAASGKQFVLFREVGKGGVGLETRNITRIRDLGDGDEDAYIGR